MLEDINKKITEKTEKFMTNEKVEAFINNVGGAVCFFGAIVFAVMFFVCGASLIKTGKNYVMGPVSGERTESAVLEPEGSKVGEEEEEEEVEAEDEESEEEESE